MSTPTALVQKLWNYCNILRDAGLSQGKAQGGRWVSVAEELKASASASPFCRKPTEGLV